jgi:hypothetical protein
MTVKFTYIGANPYVVKCMDGIDECVLRLGDVIEKTKNVYSNIVCYKFGDHYFNLNDDLKKYLVRRFTNNEEEYWEKLRHQAAISAMQGFIINGCPDKGTPEETREYLARTSAQVADAMIDQLIKQEE